MIDWLYESTLDISILIVIILLIRNPVRRLLGAHVSYWLWSLPLLRIIFSNKFERPEVITKYLNVPETDDLIPTYTSPIQPSDIQIDMLAVIWLTGMCMWGLFKLIQNIKFKSLLHEYADNISVKDLLTTDLLKNLSNDIQFKHCAAIEGPLITGLVKPTIYLPKDFFHIYDEQQRLHILQHELTHAKRKDLWAQFMAEMFKTIFWFNPLVHIAWHKFQQDQEMACDHQVLKHADSQTRIAYGQTLCKGLSALLTPNSLTFFNHKHERFIMLSKHKNSLFISLSGLIIITLIAYLTLTETNVSFTDKSSETNGQLISYEFKEIPLTSIAFLLADASGGVENFQNLNLLNGITITAKADQVYAFDFFDQLLKDHQIKVTRDGKDWRFSTT
ncbi:hypothetical protein OS175_03340 [Marinicella sp. S1101]|uniref:M56 family metallopeptidase n=1 Tax=Marinicella marina TaxID=2996016 RepID=UPI0022608CCC|nr:M56 family metallopeptidase [Marinicella marina]MCX7552903.1 hypothetical protein [Marinicella marina]MDJ1139788.1 M56 family metallopeptidase [Marinicella marina]